MPLSGYPITKVPELYPGQWGIQGSDSALGIRTHPDAIVLYVDSGSATGSASNDGTDPRYPLLTLASAVAKCTAGRGDTIVLAEGHAENITDADLTLNVAGINVVGLGRGASRPTFTFTAAPASLIISSANITLENLIFVVGIDSVAIMVDVNADDFSLINCEFREGTAMQWLTAVDINGGGANAADRAKIYGCKFVSLAAGANHAIEIGAVEDGIEIVGNWIHGDFAVAGIHSGSVLTNLLLKDNAIANLNAGDWAVELTAAVTGMAIDNRFYGDSIATIFDPGSLFCAGNLAVDAIDQSAVAIPVAKPVYTEAGIEVVRAAAALPQTAQAALFNVTGGRIKLIDIYGEVTVQIGAVANGTQLVSNPTVGADVDLCTDTDINGDAVGTIYGITGTFASAMVKSASGTVVYQATPTVIPVGAIELDCAASDGGGGRVKWTLHYLPLEDGAMVTAA